MKGVPGLTIIGFNDGYLKVRFPSIERIILPCDEGVVNLFYFHSERIQTSSFTERIVMLTAYMMLGTLFHQTCTI
jgi:hypothetical protein